MHLRHETPAFAGDEQDNDIRYVMQFLHSGTMKGMVRVATTSCGLMQQASA